MSEDKDERHPLVIQGYIYIIGAIGQIEEDDVPNDCAPEVCSDLWEINDTLPKNKPITLVISSEGGDIEPALAIISTINMIRSKGRQVNVHIAGWAFSAAAWISQFCDHRSIEPYGGMMLHGVQDENGGNSTTRERITKFNRKLETHIFSTMAERTGKTVEFYREKIKLDWYVTAQEALDQGLVDEIVSIPALPKATITTTASVKQRSRSRKKATDEATLTTT